MIGGLALDESLQVTPWRIETFDDEVDPTGSIARTEQVEQRVHLRLGTLRDDEHPPIGEIRRRTDQTELQGARARPPAESDALDLSVNVCGHPNDLVGAIHRGVSRSR